VNPETLRYVACPGLKSESPPCLGTLSLASRILPVRSDGDREEVTEALCVCEGCGGLFPVVAGVPVLVPDLGRYLRGSYLHLRHVMEEPSLVSKTMLAWLQQRMLDTLDRKGERLIPPQPGGEPGDLMLGQKWTGAYLWAHYDRRLPGDETPPVVRAVLTAVERSNPHRSLETMMREHAKDLSGLAVDVGCSVGGFTARLAAQARYAVGIDLSLDKLLHARRALRHAPAPLSSYRFFQEGNRWTERDISTSKTPNADVVLASALRLPIPTGECDIVATVNVVDIVEDPHLMLTEMQRILRSGGLLLLASPYLDTNKAVTDHLALHADPAATVRSMVSESCDIVAEVDAVPWVIRNARRRFQLLLDHCLAAVKR
jgi:SAM-dependent methyltransferase/uncharacterized protein YbaR (Trm112 family)